VRVVLWRPYSGPRTANTEGTANLTRAAAAELAGVDVRTIDRWANDGRITRYKIGGLQWVRFKRSEILDMKLPQPTIKEKLERGLPMGG
jgi:excisionase family DNA binding protein